FGASGSARILTVKSFAAVADAGNLRVPAANDRSVETSAVSVVAWSTRVQSTALIGVTSPLATPSVNLIGAAAPAGVGETAATSATVASNVPSRRTIPPPLLRDGFDGKRE